MPIVEGSVPAALPGGEARASARPNKPGKPLLARTPARSELAFESHGAYAFKKPTRRMAFKMNEAG